MTLHDGKAGHGRLLPPPGGALCQPRKDYVAEIVEVSLFIITIVQVFDRRLSSGSKKRHQTALSAFSRLLSPDLVQCALTARGKTIPGCSGSPDTGNDVGVLPLRGSEGRGNAVRQRYETRRVFLTTIVRSSCHWIYWYYKANFSSTVLWGDNSGEKGDVLNTSLSSPGLNPGPNPTLAAVILSSPGTRLMCGVGGSVDANGPSELGNRGKHAGSDKGFAMLSPCSDGEFAGVRV
ncbi:hypothetical protein BaRGS_00020572, partial [Batillaria attramentaria]